jgi:hypothetical protein
MMSDSSAGRGLSSLELELDALGDDLLTDPPRE